MQNCAFHKDNKTKKSRTIKQKSQGYLLRLKDTIPRGHTLNSQAALS